MCVCARVCFLLEEKQVGSVRACAQACAGSKGAQGFRRVSTAFAGHSQQKPDSTKEPKSQLGQCFSLIIAINEELL